MGKSNQKCVRLSDRAVKVVEQYRGDNFSDKLENLLTDYEYKREQMVLDWNRLHSQILDKHDEMKAIQERVRRLRLVDARLEALSDAVLDLLEIT